MASGDASEEVASVYIAEIILTSVLAVSVCGIATLIVLIIRRARNVVRIPYPWQENTDETDGLHLERVGTGGSGYN